MGRAPGGTLTVLFTDLVGSTELMQRLGDESQPLRRAHDRILRQQFESHGGTVIKGTGDGFFVTFPTARQGVECGCAVQRAIAAQQAEGRYLELNVRAGIHTGEPVVEADDVFGTDVTLAARLMSEAQGGEIIVSEVTYLLVRQHAFEMQPAGEWMLKGFPEAVPAYRVLWAEEGALHRRLSRFIGRHDEQARLHARLEALLQGQGGLVLIAGEPGVGKTRLATELAVQAQDHGARVLTGRAYETEGLPPYFPFADALGQFLRARSPDDRARLIAGDAAYVTRMLPELRGMVSMTEPPALSPEAERYLLFDAASNLLARLAEETPLFLLLDDLHWADHATVHLLRHLVRRIANVAVLVVATYREVELGDSHPLAGLVAEIARRGPGECLALQPLSRNDAADLVEDVFGQRPPAGVADALFATAEGNPFFTEELVRHLRDQGPAQAEPATRPAGASVPERVRQVVLQRLGLLGKDATALLVRCAMLGHDLSVRRIGAVMDLKEGALLELIEQALEARALREAGDGFAFAHPLIRETLYQGLIGLRRRLLHRQVGEALERLYAEDIELHLPELAHHFLEAATDSAGAAKALDYASRAAGQALSVFAPEDAVALYLRSLDTLERAGSRGGAARCNVLLALGDAQARAGEGASAEQAIRQAALLAEEQRLPDQLARAALGYHYVRGSATGTVDEFFIHLVDEACRALPQTDSPLRARLLALRSTALYHVEPHERLAVLSEEALAMARRLEDPPTLVWVLSATHIYRHHPNDVTGRLESANEILGLAERHGPRETTLRARLLKIAELLQLGEIDALDAELDALQHNANALRLPLYLWHVAVCRAMRALLSGELAEAERLAQHAYAIGREVPGDSGLAFQFLAIQLFALRREQGRLDELLPVVQSFIEQYPALRWRVGLAYVYCDLGRLEEARYEFEHMASDDFAELPLDFNWLISATILAEVCHRLDDAKRAVVLYDLLLPHADRAASIGDTVACNGAVSRYLGLLAATTRNWDAAERHFAAAIEMNQRMGARSFVAHTQQEFAEMLLGRGDGADRERARTHLDEATAIATELGMSHLLKEIEELRE